MDIVWDIQIYGILRYLYHEWWLKKKTVVMGVLSVDGGISTIDGDVASGSPESSAFGGDLT